MDPSMLIPFLGALLLLGVLATTAALWYQNREVQRDLIDPAPPVPEGGEFVYECTTRRLYKTPVEPASQPELADPNENAQQRTEREVRLRRLLNARPDVQPRPAVAQAGMPPPSTISIYVSESPEAAKRRARRKVRLKHLIRQSQSAGV